MNDTVDECRDLFFGINVVEYFGIKDNSDLQVALHVIFFLGIAIGNTVAGNW